MTARAAVCSAPYVDESGGRRVKAASKRVSTKTSGSARARVPSAPGRATPADATDAASVVLAPPARGQGSPARQPTTPSGLRGAEDEESAAAGVEESTQKGAPGETKGARKRGRGEGGTQGRTQSRQGGAPQVRVPTAAEGAEAGAINQSDNSISSNGRIPLPAVHHTLSPDTPPSSGEYIPASEDTHMSSTDSPPENTLSLSIAIDPPPEYPEPGTVKTQPKLGRNHGRGLDGKVLPHERTDVLAKQVARWVACGAGDNEIAAYLGIRVGQLRKFYKHELETGQFENNMDVAGTILNLAKAGVPQMSIFWAKARMGWRDTDKNDQNNNALLNIHIHT